MLSNTKDKIEKHNRTNVIYSIPCQCGQNYIGETSQFLIKRLNQHSYTCKNSKNADKSALATHHHSKQHNFHFDKTKILTNEGNTRNRKIKESIYITKNLQNTVNFKTDIRGVGLSYAHIINKLNI